MRRHSETQQSRQTGFTKMILELGEINDGESSIATPKAKKLTIPYSGEHTSWES
jgi:hypothetical protein